MSDERELRAALEETQAKLAQREEALARAEAGLEGARDLGREELAATTARADEAERELADTRRELEAANARVQQYLTERESSVQREVRREAALRVGPATVDPELREGEFSWGTIIMSGVLAIEGLINWDTGHGLVPVVLGGAVIVAGAISKATPSRRTGTDARGKRR